jgi:hypothetical protein
MVVEENGVGKMVGEWCQDRFYRPDGSTFREKTSGIFSRAAVIPHRVFRGKLRPPLNTHFFEVRNSREQQFAGFGAW